MLTVCDVHSNRGRTDIVDIVNPYASPTFAPELRAAATSRNKPRVLRAVGRWTLICSISAAPSFFWGCGLHSGSEHIAGMLCGILVFIGMYALAECSPLYQRVSNRPYVRRTLIVGYATRMGVSIVFPVGLMFDMCTGMLAVAVVQEGLFQTSGPKEVAFAAVFVTTLVQGCLLNLILTAYMLVVFAAQWLWGKRRAVDSTE